MRSVTTRLLLVLCLQAVAGRSYAQEPSPRDLFQAAVVAYQKEAVGKNALQVIARFKELEPPPAMPEEAREVFIMGATVLKKAGTPAELGKAIEHFTRSLHHAPWFAEAWYNRALARQTAGQFGAAIDDLKLYLEFKLADADRREAQDKIYALKAEAELAAVKEAEAVASRQKVDQEKAAEAAKFAWILGDWTIDHPAFNGPARSERVSFVKQGDLINDTVKSLTIRGKIGAGDDILWEQQSSAPGFQGQWLPLRVTFSQDRRTATILWPVPTVGKSTFEYYPQVASKLKRK